MSQFLQDPFGNVREHPNFALCIYATRVFDHIRGSASLKQWWYRYGPLYQGVTINGRNVHGIHGSPHFYKRIDMEMDLSVDTSDEDEEMSNTGDESNSEETRNEEEDDSSNDDMSYEPSHEESSDDEDNMMNYLGNIDPEIIDLTKDDD